MKLSVSLALLMPVLGLVGCKGNSDTPAPPAQAASVKIPKIEMNVDAGVPIGRSKDDKGWKSYVATRQPYLGVRQDPFKLTSIEQSFEENQQSERLAAAEGWFPNNAEEPKEKEQEPVEIQPYRRLIGVVIANTVTALIDMGGGNVQLIRPGMYVPGTQWFVVSIDEDKAVLRRSGKVQPKEITVKLESAPPDANVFQPTQPNPNNTNPNPIPGGGGGRGRGRGGGGG